MRHSENSVPLPLFQYKQDCKVTVELLDNMSEGATETATETKKWSKYGERERRFSTTGDAANNGNSAEKEDRDVSTKHRKDIWTLALVPQSTFPHYRKPLW